MFVTRVATLAGRLLVLVLIVVGFAAASPRNDSPSVAISGRSAPILSEPTLAADYLTSYAHGDEAAADRIASPLYRAEWARRGLTVADRQALHPTPGQSGASVEWIHFDYVGGATDWHGFGHLLYLAHPDDPSRSTTPSAWRVDTDPSGRVIWAEMVFLFSDSVTSVSPVVEGNATPGVPAPGTFGLPYSRPVAGLQARDSHEGYYAVTVQPPGMAASPNAASGAIAFYAIDSDGRTRPGAWTYGQGISGPSAYGTSPHRPVVSLEPEMVRLEQSYLQALW